MKNTDKSTSVKIGEFQRMDRPYGDIDYEAFYSNNGLIIIQGARSKECAELITKALREQQEKQLVKASESVNDAVEQG